MQYTKEQKQMWKRTALELPDDDMIVITYTPGRNEPVWLSYHDDSGWRYVDGDLHEPTHWLKLPSIP